MAELSRHYSTPVADDWNWTARVRSELDANKAWQRNWGFLVEERFLQQPPRQSASVLPATTTAPAASTSAPATAATTAAAPPGGDALSAFMQQTGGQPTNYIAAKQRDSARARRFEQQDSLDGFVSAYLNKGDPRTRQLPAQEFRKPLTTSHEYGWGRNLEVFGGLALVMK